MKNNLVRHLALLVVFLAITNFAQAQTSIIDHSFDTWWSNINQYKLNDKWALSSELHVRRADGLADWQQFLFRPAINYKLNKQTIFTAGYTYVLSYPYGEQPINQKTTEHNFWEQVTLNNDFGKLKISHRYRLEHRFIENPTTNSNTYAQRFRYRLTGTYPISDKFFTKGFDEIWINTANNLMPTGLNQNWLYGGFGYKITDKANAELGFMNQVIKKGDGVHFESNPTIQATISYNFDFSKKEK